MAPEQVADFLETYGRHISVSLTITWQTPKGKKFLDRLGFRTPDSIRHPLGEGPAVLAKSYAQFAQ